MIHQLFAIHDSKAQAYLPPFIIHKNDMALRVFADCINDRNHQFGKNPADYTLFNIGEFDDNKGAVTKGLNISLANGVELINPETADQSERIYTDPPIGDLEQVKTQ